MTNTLETNLSKIYDILAQYSSEDIVLSPETLISECATDSLEVAEIFMRLEQIFNIAIPDTHIRQLLTIGDIEDYIKKHKPSTEQHYTKISNGECPICGGELIPQGGCQSCIFCGFNGCSN